MNEYKTLNEFLKTPTDTNGIAKNIKINNVLLEIDFIDLKIKMFLENESKPMKFAFYNNIKAFNRKLTEITGLV